MLNNRLGQLAHARRLRAEAPRVLRLLAVEVDDEQLEVLPRRLQRLREEPKGGLSKGGL